MADILSPPAVAGYAQAWDIPLVDGSGEALAYDGGSTFDVEAVRHDGSASLTMSVAFGVPDDGIVVLSGSAAQYTSGGPGEYRVRIGVIRDGIRSLGYDGTLVVLAPSVNVARLALEAAIYGQSGPNLAMVGLDQVVGAETRALDLPIARALAGMGLPPTSFVGVIDADLALVPGYAQGQFHDLLNARVLELILDRWDGYDFTAGSENASKLGDLRKSIEATLARKEKSNGSRYTPGCIVPDPGATPPVQNAGKLTAGSFNLNIRSRCYDGEG